MNAIFLIARKDLRSYFHSPIAYIVIAVFLLIVGLMFSSTFSYFTRALMDYSQLPMGGKPTLTDNVLRPLFGNINVVMLFVVPFITMRLLAEERKDHTIELLLTAPLRSYQIVLGKFLAGCGILMAMILLTIVYPLILQFVSSPDWGVVAGSYLGMLLIAATYVAVGLFWSSVTENQIVAAVLTFGTLLLFWLVNWPAHRADPLVAEILNNLSLLWHFTNFASGVIETADIIYYVTFTAFALFLTNLSVESQ